MRLLSYFTVVRRDCGIVYIHRHQDNEDDKSQTTHLMVNALIQRVLIGMWAKQEYSLDRSESLFFFFAYYLFEYQCILTSDSIEKNNNDDRLKNALSSQFYECKWFHLRLGCVCVCLCAYTLNEFARHRHSHLSVVF